jgi:peroxiredoxin Q/BCP
MKLNIENRYDVLLESWEVKNLALKDILGRNKTILYFYPKDNTPGCIIENKDFTALKSEFEALDYKLVWVSKDSIESHKRFIEKQDLKNDLISDPDLVLHKELWVWGEKKNYWKVFYWVIRSTFIVDNSWEVLQEYRNIRAKWHAERILEYLELL